MTPDRTPAQAELSEGDKLTAESVVDSLMFKCDVHAEDEAVALARTLVAQETAALRDELKRERDEHETTKLNARLLVEKRPKNHPVTTPETRPSLAMDRAEYRARNFPNGFYGYEAAACLLWLLDAEPKLTASRDAATTELAHVRVELEAMRIERDAAVACVRELTGTLLGQS